MSAAQRSAFGHHLTALRVEVARHGRSSDLTKKFESLVLVARPGEQMAIAYDFWGRWLFNRQDFSAAAEKFNLAHAQSEDPGRKVNLLSRLARCQRRQGLLRDALASLAAAEDIGLTGSATRRVQAQRRLVEAEIRQRLPWWKRAASIFH
jgi:hypothetical protein